MQLDPDNTLPNNSRAPLNDASPRASSTIPLTHHADILSNEDLSPINRLSPEVLLLIFLVIPHPPSNEGTFSSRSISQVCTSWRALALSSPMMWNNIFYDSELDPFTVESKFPNFSRKWLEIQLERSGTAPLDVVSHGFQILDFLEDHAKFGQIKRLKIAATYWRADHLTKLFSSPAGELETFDLQCDHEYPYPGGALDLSLSTNFFVGPTPKLRELRLYQAHVDFSAISTATLRSLRVLKLEFPNLRKATAWLSILQEFTGLECLHLIPDWRDKLTGLGAPIGMQSSTSPPVPVSFLRLRELKIQCTAPDLIECIAYLTIPSPCSITLECVEVDPMADLIPLANMMKTLLNKSDPSCHDVGHNLVFSFEAMIMVHGIFLIFNHSAPSTGLNIQYALDLYFKRGSSLAKHSFSLFHPFLSAFCFHAAPISLNTNLQALSDSKHGDLKVNKRNMFTPHWNPDVYQWLEMVHALKGIRSVALLLPSTYRSARKKVAVPVYVPWRNEREEGLSILEVTELKNLEIIAPTKHCEFILEKIVKLKDCALNVTIIEQECEGIGYIPSVLTSLLNREQETYTISSQFTVYDAHFFLYTTSSPGSNFTIPRHEFHLTRGKSIQREWREKMIMFGRGICAGRNIVKFKTDLQSTTILQALDTDSLDIRRVFAVKEEVEVTVLDG